MNTGHLEMLILQQMVICAIIYTVSYACNFFVFLLLYINKIKYVVVITCLHIYNSLQNTQLSSSSCPSCLTNIYLILCSPNISPYVINHCLHYQHLPSWCVYVQFEESGLKIFSWWDDFSGFSTLFSAKFFPHQREIKLVLIQIKWRNKFSVSCSQSKWRHAAML